MLEESPQLQAVGNVYTLEIGKCSKSEPPGLSQPVMKPAPAPQGSGKPPPTLAFLGTHSAPGSPMKTSHGSSAALCQGMGNSTGWTQHLFVQRAKRWPRAEIGACPGAPCGQKVLLVPPSHPGMLQGACPTHPEGLPAAWGFHIKWIPEGGGFHWGKLTLDYLGNSPKQAKQRLTTSRPGHQLATS